MSIYGMPIDEMTKLAKRVKDNREFVGLSREDLAKILGISIAEVEYLEGFSLVESRPETKTKDGV